MTLSHRVRRVPSHITVVVRVLENTIVSPPPNFKPPIIGEALSMFAWRAKKIREAKEKHERSHSK